SPVTQVDAHGCAAADIGPGVVRAGRLPGGLGKRRERTTQVAAGPGDEKPSLVDHGLQLVVGGETFKCAAGGKLRGGLLARAAAPGDKMQSPVVHGLKLIVGGETLKAAAGGKLRGGLLARAGAACVLLPADVNGDDKLFGVVWPPALHDLVGGGDAVRGLRPLLQAALCVFVQLKAEHVVKRLVEERLDVLPHRLHSLVEVKRAGYLCKRGGEVAGARTPAAVLLAAPQPHDLIGVHALVKAG